MENKEKWIKYLIIGLCTFFGAFLAFYFVADQVAKRMFMPMMPMQARHMMMPMPKMEKIMRDERHRMEREFERMEKGFMKNEPDFVQNSFDENEYKIVVDLSKFDNNAENVDVDIEGNRADVKAKATTKKGTHEFREHFVFPKKINKDLVTKTKSGNKYIITLPFED